MDIALLAHQEAWLRLKVANGDFASIEAAARDLFDLAIAVEVQTNQSDDLAWAKPLVDEARASITKGEVMSLDEFETHTAALLASLKS